MIAENTTSQAIATRESEVYFPLHPTTGTGRTENPAPSRGKFFD